MVALWGLSLLATTCYQGIRPLEYMVRYDFVASELCVERDIESSTCDGQCQMKEVAPLSEHDQQPAGMPVVEELVVPVVFHSQVDRMLACLDFKPVSPNLQLLAADAPICAGFTDIVAPPPKC